jgi:hypothetical protein
MGMRSIAALGAFIAASAAAQSTSPAWAPVHGLDGRVLLASCRQGECAWLHVSRVERVSGDRHGELRRLVGRSGTTTHGMADPPSRYSRRLRVAWEDEDRSDYVFCSREQPAYAFPDEGGRHIAHYLDLFDLAGYQYASATLYLRVCHDRALSFDAAALRRLGYRPGTRSEQVENARPEELANF